MKKKDKLPINDAELQQCAKEITQKKTTQRPKNLGSISSEESGQTLQEPQLHQIELEHQLRERVKELQAFYNLSRIVEKNGITLDEIYQEIVNILPESWQYPKITCARIVIGNSEFRTKNFAESAWRQSAPIYVYKSVVGSIEVGYLEEMPKKEEGPFLKEERLLIDAIAERLGYVAERKQAEEMLRESLAQYADLYENAPDMYASVNPETGRIIRCNKTLAQTTGYRKEELIGLPVFDIYHPDCLEKVRKTFQQFVTTGEVHNVELQVRRKDGSKLDVSLNVSSVRDTSGKILFSRSSLRDITERKQAEEKINWLASFPTLNPTPILEIDQEKGLTFINTRTKELFPDLENKQIDHPFVAGLTKYFTELNSSTMTHDDREVEVDGHWYLQSLFLSSPNQIRIYAIDITKRKKTEEALRESEERFWLALNATEDGIWEWDIQSNQEFFSPRWCEIVGYSFDDPELPHTYQSWESRIHPDDLDRVISARNNHLEKGTKYDVNYLHRHKSGEYRWQNSIGQAFFDKNGKLTKMVGCIRDITRRMQIEIELNRQKEILQKIFDHIPIMISYYDKNKKIRMINQEHIRVLGWTLEEWKNENIMVKCHPEPEELKEVLDFMNSGKNTWKDFKTTTKYGIIIDETWKNISLSDGSSIGIGMDITQRNQIMTTLRESEDKYKSLIDNIPNIIFTIDLEGKITFISRIIKKILGYESTEIINRNVLDLIPKEDRQMVMESIQKGMMGEKIKHFQTPIIRKSGERLLFECSFSRIYKDGAVIGAQGTAVDITERKQVENNLRESENRFRELFSHISSGISVYEAKDDGQDFIFKDVNPAEEKIDQIRKEDLLGESVLKMFPTAKDYGLFKVFQEVWKTGKPQYYPPSLYQDQRISSWREHYVYPLPSGEIVSVCDDITERKQNELILLLQRDLALSFSSSHQLEEALLKCLDILCQISEIDCGGIYLIDKNSGDLNLICHKNLSSAFVKDATHYPADSDHVKLISQGEPLFLNYSKIDLPLSEVDKAEGLLALVLLPLIYECQVIGYLNLASHKFDQVSKLSQEVLKSTINLMGEGINRLQIENELQLSNQRLQKALNSTILGISLMLEKKDPYTTGHQKRVTKLAIAIAEEINLSPAKREVVNMAGILHDIGKIEIPTDILNKPGRLNEMEFSLIKSHSQTGSNLLTEMDLPGELSAIILQHHERMDGSGYPSGLSGEAILLEARILAVADVVEAMASHRPYRPSLGLDIALEEITQNKGKLYDLKIVDACLKLFKEKGFQF